MKIRKGFVSNSSSSSFIILKSCLSPRQLQKIVDHVEEGAKLDISCPKPCDEWRIEVTDREVKGSTTLDNFGMEEFLREIGVDFTDIEWGD